MTVDASGAAQQQARLDSSRVRIAGAIKQAASVTGTSFEYLLATAKMESDFNPSAVASTSSARGLFQFIDQTWLGTVKEAGPALGYGQYAAAITRTSSGHYTITDPSMRNAILKLRDDPAASSAMAGVLARSNSFKLTGQIGRRPSDGELYMAHFMGVGGAAKLISNAEDNPKASGAALFPNAAAANRSIFYDRGGRARSVSEVYSVLMSRYASAANSKATRSAMAAVGSAAPTAVASASGANAAYLSALPDARTATPVTLASNGAGTQGEPIFRTLFQVGPRSEPLSGTVQQLWGPNAAVASSGSTAPETNGIGRFDLFSDRTGKFSS